MLILGPNSQSEQHSFLNELSQLRHANPQTVIDVNVKARRKLYKTGMTRAHVDQILGPSLYRSKRRIASDKRAEESKLAGEEGSTSDNEATSMDVNKATRSRATAGQKSYKQQLAQLQKVGRKSRKKAAEESAPKTKATAPKPKSKPKSKAAIEAPSAQPAQPVEASN